MCRVSLSETSGAQLTLRGGRGASPRCSEAPLRMPRGAWTRGAATCPGISAGQEDELDELELDELLDDDAPEPGKCKPANTEGTEAGSGSEG